MLKESVRLLILEEGKRISELHSGDDLWRLQHKWMTKRRVADWRGNWYRETITDPQTGENCM